MMDETARSPGQLGHILKRRRKELGLTQHALAQMVGTRQATISFIEKGSGAYTKTVFDIINALGLEIALRIRQNPTISMEDIF